jgi:hypothetical protein
MPRKYQLIVGKKLLTPTSISSKTEPKIQQKLGLDSSTWLETVESFSLHFYAFVGSEDKLESIWRQQNIKWLIGIQTCRKLFSKNNQLCI